jgi:hypothetical protein
VSHAHSAVYSILGQLHAGGGCLPIPTQTEGQTVAIVSRQSPQLSFHREFRRNRFTKRNSKRLSSRPAKVCRLYHAIAKTTIAIHRGAMLAANNRHIPNVLSADAVMFADRNPHLVFHL